MPSRVRLSHKHRSGGPGNERSPRSVDSSRRPSKLSQVQQSLGNRVFGRFIQAKLKVSQPGDEYEQEADRVADQIMRMPDADPLKDHSAIEQSLAPPGIQRACSKCEPETAAHMANTNDNEGLQLTFQNCAERWEHLRESVRREFNLSTESETDVYATWDSGEAVRLIHDESLQNCTLTVAGEQFGQAYAGYVLGEGLGTLASKLRP